MKGSNPILIYMYVASQEIGFEFLAQKLEFLFSNSSTAIGIISCWKPECKGSESDDCMDDTRWSADRDSIEMDIEFPLGKDDIIGRCRNFNWTPGGDCQSFVQKMSLKEGRGSDSIEINTDSFLCAV